MTLNRRRFLAITGACVLGGAQARAAASWRGVAFGADAAITLRGVDAGAAETALDAARAVIARMEGLFSLYRPDSALSVLNRDGRLADPPQEMGALLAICDDLHAATGGVFDPTVQPLWRLLAASAPGVAGADALAAASALIGWDAVAREDAQIRLMRPGMALTLNGIAQGFATDRVTETLAAHGFGDILVDIGEFRAGGGAWRIGVEDPVWGVVSTRTLSGEAVATSSPGALRFGPQGPTHILDARHPAHTPLWSTASVTARSAALADAFSTAFCHMPLAQIAQLRAARPEVSGVLLVGADGNIRSV